MVTIYDRHDNCPRNAIPEILLRISMKGHKEIAEEVKKMGIPAEEVIELLNLEISRLLNNMVSCRKSAKRAKVAVCQFSWERKDCVSVVQHEADHIINVVNTSQYSTEWWK